MSSASRTGNKKKSSAAGSLIALLAFGVLLAGWIVWSNRPDPVDEAAAPPQEERTAMTFDAAQVERLILDVGDHDRRVIAFRGPDSLRDGSPVEGVPARQPWDTTEWVIEEPINARGDYRTLDPLIRALANFQPGRRLQDGDEGLDQYGLDRPQGSVEVILRDGTRHIVRVGAASPLQEGDIPAHYIQIAGVPGVWLMQGHFVDLVSRSAEQLRDTSLVRPDPADVQWVRLAGGDDSDADQVLIRLSAVDAFAGQHPAAAQALAGLPDQSIMEDLGETWVMLADGAVWPADGNRIDTMLRDWVGTRAVDARPLDESDSESDEPWFTVAFGVLGIDEVRELEIRVGRPTLIIEGSELAPVQRLDEPWVLAVPAPALEALAPRRHAWSRPTMLALRGQDLIQRTTAMGWTSSRGTVLLEASQDAEGRRVWSRNGETLNRASMAESWVRRMTAVRGVLHGADDLAGGPFDGVVEGSQKPTGSITWHLTAAGAEEGEAQEVSASVWEASNGDMLVEVKPYGLYLQLSADQIEEFWREAGEMQ